MSTFASGKTGASAETCTEAQCTPGRAFSAGQTRAHPEASFASATVQVTFEGFPTVGIDSGKLLHRRNKSCDRSG